MKFQEEDHDTRPPFANIDRGIPPGKPRAAHRPSLLYNLLRSRDTNANKYPEYRQEYKKGGRPAGRIVATQATNAKLYREQTPNIAPDRPRGDRDNGHDNPSDTPGNDTGKNAANTPPPPATPPRGPVRRGK
jgi:hypothetical protein